MKNGLRRYFTLLLFCLVASLPLITLAQESKASFQDLFQSGVKLYQEKKFPEAKEVFHKALEFEKNNVQALTNLGLTYFQLGEKGWAIALLRRANNLDPDFSTPMSALKFILPQLDVKEIPHEINSWETLRAKFIQPFSVFSFVLLSAILLFASGWTWIRFLSLRRRAEEEEKPFPNFPFVGLIYSASFLLLFSLMGAKFYDLSLVRGTLVAMKAPVLSLPDEKAPILFELSAGLEVIVLKKEGEWTQVQYPGGMSGWTKNDGLFITQGDIE